MKNHPAILGVRQLTLGLTTLIVCAAWELPWLAADAKPLSYPRDSAAKTAAAVALVLEHQDLCSRSARTLLEVMKNEAVDKDEERESIASYNRNQGVGDYAAARWIYGAVSKLLSDRDEAITADVKPVVRQVLEISGKLCEAGASYPKGTGSLASSGESKLKSLAEAKAKLAVVAPMTFEEKKTAFGPYQREIDEVTQAALLEADPLGNRPRSAAEWAEAEAEYKAWVEKKEREALAAQRAKTEAQKQLEAERAERLRRGEERDGKRLAPGMNRSAKQQQEPPREQTQQVFKELEKRVAAEKHHTRVHHWHADYGEKIVDLKKVLGLYLHPMKDGPSGYTCEALAMRAGILLADEELLSSPVPAINEHLAAGLRYFQAAGDACVKGERAQADLQIQAATRALGKFGKELEKYKLAP